MPAQPFLKWIGGKRKLLPELAKRLPAFGPTPARYHEPFVGGGALFFAMQPQEAILSDINERLVRTYCAVRDSVEDVIAKLKIAEENHTQYAKDFYMFMRDRDVDSTTSVDVAAWFIYLNKTCFNGVYRVNAAGKFNVPIGRYSKPPTICDEANLRLCSTALQRATIVYGDFRRTAAYVAPGDIWYADPPYVPVSETADFTGYTKEGFGATDQRDLRDVAALLKTRGANVLLSNSSTPLVHDLYKGFVVEEVMVGRAVNSATEKRGKVAEVLIR